MTKFQLEDCSPGGDQYKFLFETSTTKKFQIGQRACTSNGAVFHYAYALTAIARNTIAAAADTAAGHIGNLTMCSGTVASHNAEGSYTLKIQCSGTAMTKDQYAGGQYVIASHPSSLNSTQVCWIKSHPAAVASAECQLELYNPLAFACDSRMKGNLMTNPFMNVRTYPADANTYWPVGMTTVAVPATSYCWLQTWGPTGIVASADGTQVTSGGNIVVGSTGGLIHSATVANLQKYPLVGVMGPVDAVSGLLVPVFLRLMP